MIIILNGGCGKRFQNIYSKSKPHIPIFSKPIYQWNIDSLASDNIRMISKTNITSRVEHIYLHYSTRGPIETSKLAINKLTYVKEHIWFVDNDMIYCDTINWDNPIAFNELCVVIQYNDEIKTQTSPYSHVIIDKDTQTIKVITEKYNISPYIVVGGYGFGSVDIFNKVFDIFNSSVTQTEWYMSLLIQHAIDNNITVKYILSKNTIPIGTPEQIRDSIKKNLIPMPPPTTWYFKEQCFFTRYLEQTGHIIEIDDENGISFENISNINWITNILGFGWDNIYINNNKTYISDNIIKLNNICIKQCRTSYELLGYKTFVDNCPENIKKHIPRIYSVNMNTNQIVMNWIDGIVVTDMYTNDLLSEYVFEEIISLLHKMHKIINVTSIQNYKLNYMPKLIDRIHIYPNIYSKFDIDIVKIQDYFDDYIPTISECIHGDYWMNNMIWSQSDEMLFIIDMRGLIGKIYTIEGDIYYDYSKLYQSIIGFDHIIHRKTLPNIDTINKYTSMFRSGLCINDENFTKIKHITAIMLLGSLPYHNFDIFQINMTISLINSLWHDIVFKNTRDT